MVTHSSKNLINIQLKGFDFAEINDMLCFLVNYIVCVSEKLLRLN